VKPFVAERMFAIPLEPPSSILVDTFLPTVPKAVHPTRLTTDPSNDENMQQIKLRFLACLRYATFVTCVTFMGLCAHPTQADLPEPVLRVPANFADIETYPADDALGLGDRGAMNETDFDGLAALHLGTAEATRMIEGFQLLPSGLMYRSYLAGEKEPRIKQVMMHDRLRDRRVWESALGGRVGLLRHGTYGAVDPQGFQLDLEGAALARVLPDEPSHMLEAVDFRFGFLGTWRYHETAYKLGYYHISSHLGDEFLIANPTFDRVNYVRDSAIAGVIRDMTPDLQAYGEVGYALGAEGGAKPLELQLGTQYSSSIPWRFQGAPFWGVNSNLRQDRNFKRSVNMVAGWHWLGKDSRHSFRAGMQYFNGPSMQYSFPNEDDRMLGGGLWMDF